MHRILLPVDGSRGIDGVVEYMVSGPRARERTEIHLLNVQPPIMTGEVTHFRTVEMIARERQAAGQEILRPVRMLLDARGMRYTSQILLGDAGQTIVRYASERGCDSIVMSTRGMSAIGNLVLGSVAVKVVRHAGVPVTLVKLDRQAGRALRDGTCESSSPRALSPRVGVGSFNDACRASRKIEALGLVRRGVKAQDD